MGGWMDGGMDVHIHFIQARARTDTHIRYPAENCIFPSDGLKTTATKKEKRETRRNSICGWDELPGRKGNRHLSPEDRAVQSDRENN